MASIFYPKSNVIVKRDTISASYEEVVITDNPQTILWFGLESTGSLSSIPPTIALGGSLTRSGSYIVSASLSGSSKQYTFQRSGSYLSQVSDGIHTWSFQRNSDNQITSWTT